MILIIPTSAYIIYLFLHAVYSFHINPLNMLITALNTLSDKSKSCIIFESWCDACFVSSHQAFSCPLARLAVFC